MTSVLEGFSAIIARQAEESRKRDDEFLKQLKVDVDERICNLRNISHDELIESVMEFKSNSDPRVMVVYEEYRTAAKAELIRRLV